MERHIITNYFDTMGKAKKVYSRCLEPVCKKWNLTRNELDVLLFFCNNPNFDRAADVVSHRGIAKSHVSLAVASLEEKGFLVRKTVEGDRRAVHLKLTAEGLLPALEGREAQRLLFTQFYAGITETEFALWEKVAKKIGENLNAMENLTEK